MPDIANFVAQNFRAPDYGNVLAQAQELRNAQQLYQAREFDLEGARAERNALAGGDVNALSRINPAAAGQVQDVQSTQRKQALETMTRTMDAVGKSKNPLALGAQVLAMPDFQSALQALQLDPGLFTIDENDTPESLRAEAAELARMFGGVQSNSNLFGVVNPSDFTPDSMQTFSGSGNYGDLKPVERNLFGRYNPRDYTPESLAQFQQSGNPSDLRRVANVQFQTDPAGGILGLDPVSGQQVTQPLSSNAGTVLAGDKARVVAQESAAGEAAGKAEGAILSKATNAEGINQILDLADPLIEVATGSTAGAAFDAVAKFFGQATDGAQATAQLKVLQAAMMMSMPRMEGPQSDKDVALYQQAAADLGNPNVPRETKKAAVKTIRDLQKKYQDRAAGGTADNDPLGIRG
jgi:hypothetical protein